MLDIYHLGTVERISPEAPIPIVKVYETRVFCGGVGNTIENINSLGGKTLSQYAVSKGQFPIKNRLMVDDTQIARWDVDDKCAPTNLSELKLYIYEQPIEAVVFSDYNKGTITKELLDWVFFELKPTNVFIDCKSPWKYWRFMNTGWFFPNLKEYNLDRQMYDSVRHVILKKGPEGMEYIHNGNRIHTVRAHTTDNIKCVVGAGDTVLAAFVVRYLRRGDVQECLEFASRCAAKAVQSPYTSAVKLGEVE